MAKRILLLGASKHIGFHVLEELAPQPENYQLFVIARTPAARIADFPGKQNVRFIQGDAKDEQTVSNVIYDIMQGRVDYVVVTVGNPSPPSPTIAQIADLKVALSSLINSSCLAFPI